MYRLANSLLEPATVRELDRRAIEDHGIPGYELMCRAAEAVYRQARSVFPDANRWLVICGAGNNAGDGYVIARLAHARGIDVRVVALVEPRQLKGDAATAWEAYVAAGGIIEAWGPEQDLGHAELLIDALLGTGLDRELAGDFRDAVNQLNAADDVPVVAVDIPSGLHGGTGEILGAAVHAALTVTFVGRKRGLYLGEGPSLCGQVCFADLDIPEAVMHDIRPDYRLFDDVCLKALLPPRPADAHKGLFGHVLVVGGNLGMGGAVRLAGEAALRAGAGLVSVATRPAHVPALLAGRPELMVAGVESAAALAPLLERASVIAIGPGLGRDDWAESMLSVCLESALPLVVDADALHLVAARAVRRENWILTPHPGEAAAMLGVETRHVQADRPGALAALCERFGGTVILKGRGTLIGNGGDVPWFTAAGNPGMATAGMGDVLTGATAALLAQAPDRPEAAAAAAARVHARAGDRAAAGGQRGLLAGDLLPELRQCLNP